VIPRLLFSLILSSVLGFCSISLACPRRFCTRASVFLRSSLAVGFGSGISSCLFFSWLCFTNGSSLSMFVVSELAITVALSACYILFRTEFIKVTGHARALHTASNDITESARVFPAIFWGVLSCAAVSFILVSLRTPHGEEDAWEIWNLRARFLARATNHWRGAFVSNPSLTHLDYPLLLPITIARHWKYIGGEPG
jgi:hypothetical protein